VSVQTRCALLQIQKCVGAYSTANRNAAEVDWSHGGYCNRTLEMKEANCGTAPHRSANAWQFISITVFSRMDPLVLPCTPVELAFTHGLSGTSLKENATRDNNKIGDGRERRGRLEKRRSKKKCISERGITIFRACAPIQKIPHLLMYWPSSNWKSPRADYPI